jgi:hypothetical protein
MLARLIGYFFVGILYAAGPALLLIAIASSLPTINFVRSATAADGIIIGINRVYYPTRGRSSYLPVFRFTTTDGQAHMVMADSSASFIRFKRGDRVRVLYLNGRPETARIDTVPQLWMPQLILAFLGMVFSALSVGMLRRRRVTV